MNRAIHRAFATLVSFVAAYFVAALVSHWINSALPIVPTGERALVLGGLLVMMCVFSAIRVLDAK